MNDMGWTAHEEAQEASAFSACYDCAIRNGHTREEADNCDDGSVGCLDCPFNTERQSLEDAWRGALGRSHPN